MSGGQPGYPPGAPGPYPPYPAQDGFKYDVSNSYNYCTSITEFLNIVFLRSTCPASNFRTVHYQFWGYQDLAWCHGQTAHKCKLAWLCNVGKI
jgi:hypothetical protein